MVTGDRVRHLVQDDRLAGLRRGDDQGALPLADRHRQIHHAGGEHVPVGLQAQPLLGVEGGRAVEVRPRAGRAAVDGGDLQVDRLSGARDTGEAGYPIAAAQTQSARLRRGHQEIVGAGQEAVGAQPRTVVDDVEEGVDRDGLLRRRGGRGLRAFRRTQIGFFGLNLSSSHGGLSLEGRATAR